MIKIDVDTRCWKIPKEEAFIGVESDDKVRILKFELSKNEFCNGLNFTDCNCFINYKNEGNDTIPYLITDMEVQEDGTVTFTWEVSRGATIYKGNTFAILCAKKVSDDGTITNEWNSRIGSFTVSKGLEPLSSITEVPEIDIISQLLLVAQQTNAKAETNINQSSSLLEKAEGLGYLKEDFDVLEARMNQFTSLKEGSTTGDAELQDIRVGADGKTYDTAGDAVRGQVSELKGDLSEYYKKVVYQNNVKDDNVNNSLGYMNEQTENTIIEYPQSNLSLQGVSNSQLWILSGIYSAYNKSFKGYDTISNLKFNCVNSGTLAFYLVAISDNTVTIKYKEEFSVVSGVNEFTVDIPIIENEENLYYAVSPNLYFSNSASGTESVQRFNYCNINGDNTKCKIGDEFTINGSGSGLFGIEIKCKKSRNPVKLVNYCALGDSITAKYYSEHDSYAMFMAEKLNFNKFTNLAVGGKPMIGWGANKYAEVPDDTTLFTCLMGTNDWNLNYSLASFKSSYKSLIRNLIVKIPTIIIVLFTIPHRNYTAGGGVQSGETNANGDTISDFNQVIFDVGKEYSVPVIDLYSISGISELTFDTFTHDGLHPNLIGQKRIANIVSELIRPYCF